MLLQNQLIDFQNFGPMMPDSVQKFELFKGIVYRFYQDTLRKVVIKGGENVVGLVDVKVKDYMVSVHNGNSCNFLRDYEDKITVEIHVFWNHSSRKNTVGFSSF